MSDTTDRSALLKFRRWMTLSNLNLSLSSDLFLILGFLLEPGQEQKLEFLLEPVSVTKVLGATALLSCVVTGYPAPHVRWMLGDKLVEERYEPAIVLLPVLLLLRSHMFNHSS